MIVKFVLPTQPAGSDGGLTYYKNGQQLAARARAYPCRVRNGPSVYTRNLITQLSNYWETPLTVDDRNGWAKYAWNSPLTDAYNNPKYINGYAMFCRNNRPRLQFGIERVDTPPTDYGFPTYTPPTYTLSDDATTIAIHYNATDAWVGQDGAAMFVWASGPTPNYRTTPSERYAPLLVIQGSSTSPPTSPATATAPKRIQLSTQTLWARCSVTDAQGRLST
jgi:hypothetical protein